MNSRSNRARSNVATFDAAGGCVSSSDAAKIGAATVAVKNAVRSAIKKIVEIVAEKGFKNVVKIVEKNVKNVVKIVEKSVKNVVKIGVENFGDGAVNFRPKNVANRVSKAVAAVDATGTASTASTVGDATGGVSTRG